MGDFRQGGDVGDRTEIAGADDVRRLGVGIVCERVTKRAGSYSVVDTVNGVDFGHHECQAQAGEDRDAIDTLVVASPNRLSS